MRSTLSKLNLAGALFALSAIVAAGLGELSYLATIEAIWAVAIGCTYFRYAQRYL